MGMPQSVIDKIANARATGGGNRYTDGKYLARIEEFKGKDGFKGFSYRGGFSVLESEPADYTQPVGRNKRPEVGKPLPAGARFDVVMNVSANDSAAGNVVQLVLAGYGIDENALTNTQKVVLTKIASGEQVDAAEVDKLPAVAKEAIKTPFAKRLIIGNTYRNEISSNKNGNQGNDYVGMNWIHVPLADAEKYLAAKAQAAA